MLDTDQTIDQRIAGRVRDLRALRELSLEQLAQRSGVSRSMISLIERGETSPTAVTLEKLATGLGVVLADLFQGADAGDDTDRGPVARRDDQPEWTDPASGYRRRNVSPTGARQPMRIVDVHFPAGGRVAFESGERHPSAFQQVWMLQGSMEITVDRTRHRLNTGDCLAMQLDRPIVFHNPSRKPARYAVVLTTEGAG
jgi:transcriptional regulator with XRE-family HTH domain